MGSVTAVGVGEVMLLLLLILAGSWGAGALFTSLPSFSILRWSLGGGTGLEFGVSAGMATLPLRPPWNGEWRGIIMYC